MASRSELILQLMVRAEENLAASRLLNSSSLTSIAISRAYYAMFYAAKAALISENIEARSHSGVINQFSVNFVKTKKVESRYGRMLRTVFQRRQGSDYDMSLNFSRNEIEDSIADAEQFVAAIRKLLSESYDPE
ncbi:MAG TPA: HEPN domain-containing protein [Anaerolineae bacterium]|nr:HEPN domain-containing protein [Anaerolineae bacterium]HMR64777.1 HEPN domain-containing protein [Anaerolineae bacterium]